MKSARLKQAWALVIACVAAGGVFGSDAKPVPTLHVTDLFRPHNDPDDHWDLATQYALACQGRVDLRSQRLYAGSSASSRRGAASVFRSLSPPLSAEFSVRAKRRSGALRTGCG